MALPMVQELGTVRRLITLQMVQESGELGMLAIQKVLRGGQVRWKYNPARSADSDMLRDGADRALGDLENQYR